MNARHWLAILALLAGCAHAPPRPASIVHDEYRYAIAYSRWLIAREMRRHDLTGLAIALVDDQRVVWAQGFGYADRAHGVAVSPDTTFRVGSVTKLFTATAALQLVERGLLDLDRPLEAQLPNLAPRRRFADPAPITARRLLTHLSGLPSDLLAGMWTPSPARFDTVLAAVNEQYLTTPPGTVSAYSNLGFSVLGVALERAAGRRYEELIGDGILAPLGMRHSSIAVGADPPPRGARSYHGGREVRETPLRDLPAGGLNSSVNDLARFISFVLAGGETDGRRVLEAQSLAEMLRRQNDAVPLDFSAEVGLAWGLGTLDGVPGERVAQHAGATLHQHAMLALLPAHRLGVVVLANSDDAGPTVARVAVETLKLALESKSGLGATPAVEPPFSPAAPAARAALDGWEGRYVTTMGLIAIRRHKDALEATLAGHTVSLVPQKDGRFAVRARVLGIRVHLGALDRVTLARVTLAGRTVLTAHLDGHELLVGEQLAATPIPEAWRQRLGRYVVTNAGDDAVPFDEVALRVDDGLLVAEYRRLSARFARALRPLDDRAAVTAGLGRGAGETLDVIGEGAGERLRFSGYLLRRADGH